MTSLTFASMFKQFYSKFDKSSNNPYLHNTLSIIHYIVLSKWMLLVVLSLTQKQFALTMDPKRIVLLKRI